MEMGKYIYGVVVSGNQDSAETSASSGTSFVQYRELSAMVRESEIVDFHTMPTVSLARLLVEHQKSIERVMTAGHTIIPMRLGTFALDENAVLDILRKGYPLIMELSAKAEGKIEVDVVGAWSDFSSLILELREEKEIKAFREALMSSAKGVTVADQIKIGKMLKAAADAKREKFAAEIQTALEAVSVIAKPHELMDDKMVINSAFLIDTARQNEFYAAVDSLNAKFEEKLNFRCVGPLPPYSFYTLEIVNMDQVELTRAREKLALPNPLASRREIKRAYQRAAFSCHPDAQPGKPDTAHDFDDLRQAYKLLLNYRQALEQTGGGSSASGLKEDAILIKVKE